MLIGYARVSTLDQNFDLQIDALTKAGCHKLFEDKMSGSRAEASSTWWTWSASYHQQGVHFKSLTDAIDTGTPSGRFFFHVMASLAEMERELTGERTRAGLEVARQLGRKGGRKRKMTNSKIGPSQKSRQRVPLKV
jgi:DNA invertase Pin-like site-specific DNA recombinase